MGGAETVATQTAEAKPLAACPGGSLFSTGVAGTGSSLWQPQAQPVRWQLDSREPDGLPWQQECRRTVFVLALQQPGAVGSSFFDDFRQQPRLDRDPLSGREQPQSPLDWLARQLQTVIPEATTPLSNSAVASRADISRVLEVGFVIPGSEFDFGKVSVLLTIEFWFSCANFGSDETSRFGCGRQTGHAGSFLVDRLCPDAEMRKDRDVRKSAGDRIRLKKQVATSQLASFPVFAAELYWFFSFGARAFRSHESNRKSGAKPPLGVLNGPRPLQNS